MLFLITATWQIKTVQDKNVKNFYEEILRNYKKLISYLKEDYQIVLVGSDKKIYGDHENIFYFSHLEKKEFDDLVSIVDLYIGQNLISTSMVRIVLSAIRSVALIHSGFQSQKENIFAYRYRMFPVGWHAFLEPIVEGNLYYQLVESLEIFDLTSTYRRIREILREDVSSYESSLSSYKNELYQLE